MLFSKREIYTGYSFEQFSNIRNLLNDHNIKHKWKIVDSYSSWLGLRTDRSHFGSIGTDHSKQYMIYVHKDDFPVAQSVIRLR